MRAYVEAAYCCCVACGTKIIISSHYLMMGRVSGILCFTPPPVYACTLRSNPKKRALVTNGRQCVWSPLNVPKEHSREQRGGLQFAANTENKMQCLIKHPSHPLKRQPLLCSVHAACLVGWRSKQRTTWLHFDLHCATFSAPFPIFFFLRHHNPALRMD